MNTTIIVLLVATSIIVLLVATYSIGIPVISFILGRIKFIDWDQYEEGSQDYINAEMGILAMHIFWPLTMPVYLFFYLSRKMYRIGINDLSKQRTNDLQKELELKKQLNQLNTVPTSIKFVVGKTEGSYREPSQLVQLVIDGIEQSKDNKYKFQLNDDSSIIIDTGIKQERTSFTQLIFKAVSLMNKDHAN